MIISVDQDVAVRGLRGKHRIVGISTALKMFRVLVAPSGDQQDRKQRGVLPEKISQWEGK
jgi:hypothetical protein